MNISAARSDEGSRRHDAEECDGVSRRNDAEDAVVECDWMSRRLDAEDGRTEFTEVEECGSRHKRSLLQQSTLTAGSAHFRPSA